MSALRWVDALLVGFVITSGLNWVVAEKFLNPLIKPGPDGLIRSGGDTQVGVLAAGFALFVAVLISFNQQSRLDSAPASGDPSPRSP